MIACHAPDAQSSPWRGAGRSLHHKLSGVVLDQVARLDVQGSGERAQVGGRACRLPSPS
jgi:hypothetical protein